MLFRSLLGFGDDVPNCISESIDARCGADRGGRDGHDFRSYGAAPLSEHGNRPVDLVPGTTCADGATHELHIGASHEWFLGSAREHPVSCNCYTITWRTAVH